MAIAEDSRGFPGCLLFRCCRGKPGEIWDRRSGSLNRQLCSDTESERERERERENSCPNFRLLHLNRRSRSRRASSISVISSRLAETLATSGKQRSKPCIANDAASDYPITAGERAFFLGRKRGRERERGRVSLGKRASSWRIIYSSSPTKLTSSRRGLCREPRRDFYAAPPAFVPLAGEREAGGRERESGRVERDQFALNETRVKRRREKNAAGERRRRGAGKRNKGEETGRRRKRRNTERQREREGGGGGGGGQAPTLRRASPRESTAECVNEVPRFG